MYEAFVKYDNGNELRFVSTEITHVINSLNSSLCTLQFKKKKLIESYVREIDEKRYRALLRDKNVNDCGVAALEYCTYDYVEYRYEGKVYRGYIRCVLADQYAVTRKSDDVISVVIISKSDVISKTNF